VATLVWGVWPTIVCANPQLQLLIIVFLFCKKRDICSGDSFTKLLDTLDNESYSTSAELNEFEKANVWLSRREWVRRTKIPKELVEEQSKLQSEGYMKWVEARQEANFEKFAPILQKYEFYL